MCGQHRYRAMKSKLFSSTLLENGIIKTMVAGNIDHYINILILDELLDGLMKIERRDKIKFRIVIFELF